MAEDKAAARSVTGISRTAALYGEGESLLLVYGGTATSRSWASHLPAFAWHIRGLAARGRRFAGS